MTLFSFMPILALIAASILTAGAMFGAMTAFLGAAMLVTAMMFCGFLAVASSQDGH